MTDTRKRLFKVGTVFGMVPDGVPSEKTKKISNFLNFLKMSFFRFLTYFSSKINILLWDTFERVKNWCFSGCVNGMGFK